MPCTLLKSNPPNWPPIPPIEGIKPELYTYYSIVHIRGLQQNIKFGKKNPFSKGEAQLNQFSSNFKLTGFLNTDIKKYFFVNYLGKKGTISEDSIGGLNTDLLPNGAKVKTIDPNKKQLKISFDNEDYIFEL